mgnify:FL=1
MQPIKIEGANKEHEDVNANGYKCMHNFIIEYMYNFN